MTKLTVWGITSYKVEAQHIVYGNQKLKSEKDQVYKFAENKFIYEDYQKQDSELKKKNER